MPDYDLLWDSGLALLLILCAVMWGIVLLDTAGRRCGRAYSRVSKAEQRASTLLKEWLTPEQCSEYERRGYFQVRGSHSGKRYRIRSGRQMNVDQPIQRIVEAAPPCVGGIQRVTSIGQGDNKLWACDVCEFIVHIVSADSKIVRFGQQISDLA
jgi:hypothetical protein